MFKYDGLKLKCPVKEEGLLNLLKERIAKKCGSKVFSSRIRLL